MRLALLLCLLLPLLLGTRLSPSIQDFQLNGNVLTGHVYGPTTSVVLLACSQPEPQYGPGHLSPNDFYRYHGMRVLSRADVRAGDFALHLPLVPIAPGYYRLAIEDEYGDVNFDWSLAIDLVEPYVYRQRLVLWGVFSVAAIVFLFSFHRRRNRKSTA
jgi:hypothetical protein